MTKLLVGTRKGFWCLTSDESRDEWTIEGPEFLGHIMSHAVSDPRDRNTVLDRIAEPGDVQGSPGIERGSVRTRPACAAENRAQHLRVVGGRTAGEIGDRAGGDTVVGRINVGDGEPTLVELDGTGRASRRDLVAPVAAVDDQRSVTGQPQQRFGHGLEPA